MPNGKGYPGSSDLDTKTSLWGSLSSTAVGSCQKKLNSDKVDGKSKKSKLLQPEITGGAMSPSMITEKKR